MSLQIIKKSDEIFKLPICYLLNNQKIEKHVKTDLDLENSPDNMSLYNKIFETCVTWVFILLLKAKV